MRCSPPPTPQSPCSHLLLPCVAQASLPSSATAIRPSQTFRNLLAPSHILLTHSTVAQASRPSSPPSRPRGASSSGSRRTWSTASAAPCRCAGPCAATSLCGLHAATMHLLHRAGACAATSLCGFACSPYIHLAHRAGGVTSPLRPDISHISPPYLPHISPISPPYQVVGFLCYISLVLDQTFDALFIIILAFLNDMTIVTIAYDRQVTDTRH